MRLQSDTSIGVGTERSVTPVIAIVLLVMMVLFGATVIVITGASLLSDLQSEAEQDRAETELGEVGHTIATQTVDGLPGEVELSDDAYQLTEDGTLTVTAFGEGADDGQTVVEGLALDALEYETDNGAVAYQSGAIWQREGETSFAHSSPPIEYHTETVGGENDSYLDLSVVELAGTVGQGTHETHQTTVDRQTAADLDDIPFTRYVEIKVEDSAYAHAWASFFESEFRTDEIDANEVVHHEATDTVIVTAEVGQDRPFRDFVGIEPTIYGGLYVTGENSHGNQQWSDGSQAVDQYDSRVAPYHEYPAVDPDIYTVDAHIYNLDPIFDLSGVPVANNHLRIESSATNEPIVFHYGQELGAGDHNIHTAQLSKPFDAIDPVTDEVHETIDHFAEKPEPPSDGPIGPGNYKISGDETLSGTEIDTGTEGDFVNIAVDGDLTLSDIDVDGDGQAHLYVTGDINASDVTVPDDVAKTLWVYGTEDATVGMESTVQGIYYSPGAENHRLEPETEVFGAVVTGETVVDRDVEIHFDRSLRTDVPIPEADQDELDQEFIDFDLHLDVEFIAPSDEYVLDVTIYEVELRQ